MKAEQERLRLADGIRREPLVSVVMSFHNARDTLSRAIRSLLWQTYPHWELILLDDGSNDGSAETLRSFEDPRIRLCSNSVCRGLPVRLNQGIALAKGKYIARMDADDVAFPERFARQVAYLQDHPQVDLLATSALLVNAENQVVGLLEAGLSHDSICRSPWRGFPMPHPTWMGRTDWFRGHFYNVRARKAQDQELLFRTFRESRFAGLPEALLGYRYENISLKKSLSGRGTYLRATYAGRARPGWAAFFIKSIFYHGAAAIRDGITRLLVRDSAVVEARLAKPMKSMVNEWHELVAQLDEHKDKINDQHG